MTTHGGVEPGGESIWNLWLEKATCPGAATFQQCKGLLELHSSAVPCWVVLAPWPRAQSTDLSAGNTSGPYNGADYRYMEPLAHIATCRTHLRTRLFLDCHDSVEFSGFPQIFTNTAFQLPSANT